MECILPAGQWKMKWWRCREDGESEGLPVRESDDKVPDEYLSLDLPTHTHSELIFGISNPLLSFGTKYSITAFEVSGSISTVDAGVTFAVPAELPRIVRLETRHLTKDRTTMIVSLEGHSLLLGAGKVNLSNGTHTWESLSDVIVVDNTNCTAEFAVAEEETVVLMKYGNTYTLKGSWTESSGFHVEDGITLVVPFPPMITTISFVFSNTLHTGCFMILNGTDLIVGSSLNVTLNDSFSFVATITSETEAKSEEQQIGWPTSLKHNTTYEVTSVKATNESDGETLVDGRISNTTGFPVDPFVVCVDSGSSSESTLFCGDRVRPCPSIEDGWKIVEGVGMSSFSISILHNTTQTEQVKILSDHEVVIESGPSTKPELFVSPSSSSEKGGEGMIEVCGGRLWMHQVDIALSDSPSLIFIRMVDGHLTIETCSLTGPSSLEKNEVDANSDVCLWESGILTLVDSTTTITSAQLTHLPQGAIGLNLKIWIRADPNGYTQI
ncbi:hypothetical protein BLNAU_19961 [Blattamonas nauphoetae]|uniref:Uncharacterized protein n=1 Tax=Blattamonas nauphoetae TaxID=2049346 RepID=A0ABQ9X091_9EUKA|nr:hypothetical protein BLNAU_19961 [Blattamonas nauphoetae]